VVERDGSHERDVLAQAGLLRPVLSLEVASTSPRPPERGDGPLEAPEFDNARAEDDEPADPAGAAGGPDGDATSHRRVVDAQPGLGLGHVEEVAVPTPTTPKALMRDTALALRPRLS